MKTQVKNWLRWGAAGTFGLMLTLNVMVGLDFEKDKVLPTLTLVELGNQANAQGESSGTCDGGSCSFTDLDSSGKPISECTACCPEGKSPKCDTGVHLY